MPGFEPGNAGIKTQCLTAWRHPTNQIKMDKQLAMLAVLEALSNHVESAAKITLISFSFEQHLCLLYDIDTTKYFDLEF